MSGIAWMIDCEFCGKQDKYTGEPENRNIMLPGQQTKNLTVCKDCAKRIDALQRPALLEQERQDEEAAKAMQAKLKAEEEANKPVDATKELVGTLAQMMGMMMQQNQQIIEMLADKKAPKKKDAAAKASD